MAMTTVDVTFTEQRLRVQLNLQQVQGSVQVDRVEPQSAAHGRVAPGATLVAVNGERIRPLIGRQAWVAFCERVKNTPTPFGYVSALRGFLLLWLFRLLRLLFDFRLCCNMILVRKFLWNHHFECFVVLF